MEAIRDAEERYEPGAELVFRCVDIGKQDYLLNSTNVSYSKNCLNGSKSFLYLLWFKSHLLFSEPTVFGFGFSTS